MEEAAEQVASVDNALVILAQDGPLGRRVWRLQQQRPVGMVAVVMLDVDQKDLLEVAAPDDQQPVQTLGPDRPHPALGVRVRRGAPTGVRSTSLPSERNTSSKPRQNLASRS
jgi:hypothetical protein